MLRFFIRSDVLFNDPILNFPVESVCERAPLSPYPLCYGGLRNSPITLLYMYASRPPVFYPRIEGEDSTRSMERVGKRRKIRRNIPQDLSRQIPANCVLRQIDGESLREMLGAGGGFRQYP